ncbi:GFA family protein [Hoeflea olei]|uniref:Aldehyde-activating protein n=1 Tax=Hoeflea olei TaxID=1480615 RepID=A0A1C1YW00_9HYPH|nr:GFA family protein [Hoeflea olei]OCW57724.1 aldehyde-activating protein [Hoeflea olei]
MTVTKILAGGCQCGAVRYRVEGGLDYPHLCHCRMCQKAAGNYFMPLGFSPGDRLTLTRGEASWFQSSDPVRRGFCRDCGTPLFFDTLQSDGVAVTLGSLDEPSAVVPVSNDGVETRVPFFEALAGLAGKAVDRSDLPGGLESIASSNHQHPDHDTAHWPASEAR